jgi:hypothetical protein
MASKETFLSISDVDAALLAFEQKYKISSGIFAGDAVVRAGLPEDDAFEWAAFIDHRNELQELQQELHREYLWKVTASSEEIDALKGNSKLCLAA